ncbi:MmpS family transport accessory protein [Streptomyces sp. NPDC093224]|uniref:MmpS family transport accessory protein n=1 Tax=Streptomyces sp. NPDC093224 TaxID=3155198 RepID=UPI00342E78A5
MNPPASRFALPHRVARRTLPAIAATLLAATSLTGCGLFGKNWDVKMEVTGSGQADIAYNFSGKNKQTKVSGAELPWQVSQNVGFGFNDLAVLNAPPGTTCRIYVNGKLEESSDQPDAEGTVTCNANLQDE